MRGTIRMGLLALVGGLSAFVGGCNTAFRSVPPLPGQTVSGVTAVDTFGRFVFGTSSSGAGDTGTATSYNLATEELISFGPLTNNIIASEQLFALGNGPDGPFVASLTNPPVLEPLALGPLASIAAFAPNSVYLLMTGPKGVELPTPAVFGTNVNGPFKSFVNVLARGARSSDMFGPPISLGTFPGAGPSDSLTVVGASEDGVVVIANGTQFIAGDETTPDTYSYFGAFKFGEEGWQAIGPPGETFLTDVAGTGLTAVTGYSRGGPTEPYVAFLQPLGEPPMALPNTPFPGFSSYANTVIVDPRTGGWIIGGSIDTDIGPEAVIWTVDSLGVIEGPSRLNENSDLPESPWYLWRLTSVQSIQFVATAIGGEFNGDLGESIFLTGSGIDPSGATRGWFMAFGGHLVKPKPFAMLSPLNGPTVSVTPTLSWEQSRDASLYQLFISTASDFSVETFQLEINNDTDGFPFGDPYTYTVNPGVLSPETTYYWKITARSGGGTETPASNIAEGSFTTDNPFIFTTLSPADGAEVLPPVTVSWVAFPGAVSYIVFVRDLDFPMEAPSMTMLSGDTTSLELFVPCNGSFEWWVMANVLSTPEEDEPSVDQYFTDTVSFTTGFVEIGDVDLVAPAPEATDVILNPTLEWEPTPNAVEYRVRVYDVVADGEVLDVVTTSLFAEVPTGLLQPFTLYDWNVTAKSACNDFSFTNSRTFTTGGIITDCRADYNRDGFINLDDVSDYITDFYTFPPIPGGLQPFAPTYSDTIVGFVGDDGMGGIGCPNAPDVPGGGTEPDAGYLLEAYRTYGYRVGFSFDGSNACPLDPGQNFPSLDNLGEFITVYYQAFATFNPEFPCDR
jgi:hypothetical protein